MANNNDQAIYQYVGEKSALYFAEKQVRGPIIKYVNEAVTLHNAYGKIEQERIALTLLENVATRHTQNLEAARKQNKEKDPYLNTAFWDVKKTLQQQSQAEQWLKKLQAWAIAGYRVIVKLRQTITGQELIYHIQDEQHHYSYTLNEDQYLKLLASNNMDMSYAKKEKLDSIIKSGNPAGMAELFKLKLGGTQTKINQALIAGNKMQRSSEEEKQQLIASSRIDLKKDILYQYLINTKSISDQFLEKGKFSHSRIYELYSQLAASYKWKRDEEGNIIGNLEKTNKHNKKYVIFSKARKDDIETFAQKYVKEGLSKENIAFYRTGDAIQNVKTLIENKVGNASVSVSTIKNAITEIAKLSNITNVNELKKKFIEIFTYENKHSEKQLTSRIYNGVKTFAEKILKNYFPIIK